MSQQIRSAINEDFAIGSDWECEVVEDGQSLVAMPFNFSGVGHQLDCPHIFDWCWPLASLPGKSQSF